MHVSWNRKGSVGTMVSSQILFIGEMLTRTRSSAPILVCSRVFLFRAKAAAVIHLHGDAAVRALGEQFTHLFQTFDGRILVIPIYDLNGLNRKISCGGCSGGGCSGGGQGCPSRRAAAPGALIRRAAAKDAEAEPNGKRMLRMPGLSEQGGRLPEA